MVHIGLAELAVGGLLGWAMVAQDQHPELVKRAGVIAPTASARSTSTTSSWA
jgi:hypothetical protein